MFIRTKFVNSKSVQLQLKLNYLNHSVFVFMTLLCGSLLKLVRWTSSGHRHAITNVWNYFSGIGVLTVLQLTTMLSELALPTFDTILFNSKQRYIRCRHNVHNSLVACVNASMHW